MTKMPSISFSKSVSSPKGTLAFFVAEKGSLPASASQLNGDGRLDDAITASEFEGAFGTKVDVLAPAKGIDRIVIVGLGDLEKIDEDGWLKIGGKIFASKGKSSSVTVHGDLGDGKEPVSADALAKIAAGTKLRAYEFDTYKTKKKEKDVAVKIGFVTSDDTAAKKAWKSMDGIADGVMFARDLVNEPANILGPVEFAKKAESLKKLGCEVQILDEKKLKAEKMGALLGRCAGIRASGPGCDHALEGRQGERQARCLCRQGGCV